MRILKSVFKNPPSPPIQCCEPIALLDASFVHCFSTLLRGGRRQRHETVLIAVFPITFVTDCLKKSEKNKCSILQLVVLNHFEGMQLPITSL